MDKDITLVSHDAHPSVTINFDLSENKIEKIRPEQFRRMVEDPTISVPLEVIEKLSAKFLSEYDQSAVAASTHKKFVVNIQLFTRFCATLNESPVTCPIEIIKDYLLHRSDYNSFSSVRSDAWAISKLRERSGFSPILNDPLIKDTLSRIGRKKKQNDESVKQASGANWSAIRTILPALLKDGATRSLRDAAILSTAYAGMFRSDELLNIKMKHISRTNAGNLEIELPRSKTNQMGDSDFVSVAGVHDEILMKYIDSQKFENDEYIFKPISKHGSVLKQNRHLSYDALNAVFKYYFERLTEKEKLEIGAAWTTHSCRVGCAQDLVSQGISIAIIKKMGRWSSEDTVWRYARKFKIDVNPLEKMSTI